MIRAQSIAITFFLTASILSFGCSAEKRQSDPWAVSRCVLGHLPPSYFTDSENPRISDSKLELEEVDKLIMNSPDGLSKAIKEEVGRLWPDDAKFQRALGDRIEDSATDFSFSLAKNLSDHFQLSSCGDRKDIEMIMVSILSDKISGIFRGNSVFDTIPMGPPGRSYLVMMAAGARMNDYPNALVALSGKK